MSASQTPSPGRTPNGTLPHSSFRRKQADPLVRRKKPTLPRPAPRTSTPSGVNGQPGQSAGAKAQPSSVQSPASNQKTGSSTQSTAQEEYEDLPVYTTKRAFLQGVRHHVMRLLPNNSFENKVVDPTDESQFVRPVRLHRRDPRTSATMLWRETSVASSDGEPKPNPVDDKERERLEAAKAEKRAEREANQAQIAPTAKKAAENKKKNKLQKKTELVYKFSDSVTKEKNQRIRYEESLPWHLEDFENKNTWAGSYEAALSECHVMLVPDSTSSSFHMVPVEKWYKFTPKNQFKTLSIEEAEARMGKKIKDPRWFMETQKENERSEREKAARYGKGTLFTRQGERGERIRKSGDIGDEYEKPEETADMDDIDYDYEEAFADDEENALFEGDKEESKQAEEKLMRERREANVFELKEEKDYDEEEEEEKRRAEEEKKLAKKIEKALMKRERNFVYEDDSDRNPYASESESQDSDEEASNEEGGAKDQEGNEANDKLKAASNDKFASGASSRGTTTPSGRHKSDDLRRGHLKRPVSPNQSEASGNESSRKKVKKTHVSSSQAGSSSLAGPSISRPASPANQSANGDVRKSSVIKLNVRGGAGSGSDGEMSDGARAKTKKVKLNSMANSRAASPNGSRAGSPAAGGVPGDGQPAAKSQEADNEPAPQLPTPEDVRSRIPPEGIELTALMRIYGRRIVKNPAFVPLMKSQGRWVKEEKKFYPKNT